MNTEGKKFERISQDPNFEGRHALATDIKVSETYREKLENQLKIYKQRLKIQLKQTTQPIKEGDPISERNEEKIDIRDTLYKIQILEILLEDGVANIFELERILGEKPDFSTKTFNDAWKVIQNYAENGGKNNIKS
jgi:hypothetical protein